MNIFSKISDLKLRNEIINEFKDLLEKKYGLVYEDHQSEPIALYEVPIQVGSQVAFKNNLWQTLTVVAINKEEITCVGMEEPEKQKICNKDDLTVVVQHNEFSYPYLRQVDSICNAPDSNVWHALIEGENLSTLKLLEKMCFGKVDCIYIEPPFNNNKNGLKYENDFVDKTDVYRHSKWLSMMEKRLKVARKLLNSKDSVLIVSIDKAEFKQLGCLLEEIFPEANIQMVSSIVNPAGTKEVSGFYQTDEYLYFVMLGKSAPDRLKLGKEWDLNKPKKRRKTIQWTPLIRYGSGSKRVERPSLFYPIFVNKEGTKILRVEEPIPVDMDRNDVEVKEDETAIWPIRSDGEEGRWRVGSKTLKELIQKGFVKLSKNSKKNISISYLCKSEQERVNNGVYHVLGNGEDGSVIVDELSEDKDFLPGTQWNVSTHNTSRYGTALLNGILKGRKFNSPKSLYAVRDCLKFFVKNKPNALILDFFAGSGTTLHAVNLLNAEDNGNRRCILITNNEVSAKEAKSLTEQGYHPGDEEWEQYGIARYIAWPRIVCSVKGVDIVGKPLEGNYIGLEKAMKDGFNANVSYLKLEHMDNKQEALLKKFKKLLPVFWLKSGAIGNCPKFNEETLPKAFISSKNKFAVLLNDFYFPIFKKKIDKAAEIKTIYLTTDSVKNYDKMVEELKNKTVYRLKRNLPDSFKINADKELA